MTEQFTKTGYRVAVANLTGMPLQTTGEQLSPSDSKALAAPGKTADILSKLSEKSDFILIFTNMPAENAVVSELVENSACGVFVEKMYVSKRSVVERSISLVNAFAPNSPICIAWEE